MGIHEVVTAPRSLWQNPYVERLIGSIRRECLDHVIVLHERHLQRLLTGYFAYYHLELATGAVLTVHAYSRRIWDSPLYRAMPFTQQVERDGVVL